MLRSERVTSPTSTGLLGRRRVFRSEHRRPDQAVDLEVRSGGPLSRLLLSRWQAQPAPGRQLANDRVPGRCTRRRLEGYRQWVRESLETLPTHFKDRVLPVRRGVARRGCSLLCQLGSTSTGSHPARSSLRSAKRATPPPARRHTRKADDPSRSRGAHSFWSAPAEYDSRERRSEKCDTKYQRGLLRDDCNDQE